MIDFCYIAIDSFGKKNKGFLSAESKKDVFKFLVDNDYRPVLIKKTKRNFLTNSFFSKVREKTTVGDSFYYLGMMLQNGSSLVEGLSLLSKIKSKNKIWGSVKKDVEQGVSFSDSLRKHKCFSLMYVNMVAISEKTGNLGYVLEEISAHESNMKEIKNKAVSALTYPFIVFLVGLFAIYFMLTQIAPKMTEIFASAKIDIPKSTELIFSMGVFFEKFGIIFIFFILTFFIVLFFLYKNKLGFRIYVDSIFWKIPFVRLLVLSRFSKMFGFQLKSGINMVDSLKNASESSFSDYFSEKVKCLAKQVEQGNSVEKSMQQLSVFPPLYIMAFSSGAKSGNLPLFLIRTGEIFEKELDSSLKKIVGLIEPVTILGLGLLIGFFVMSIMSPIFDMSTIV